MKKISFFAVATLAVVLMGCSSKNTNTPDFDTTKLWPAMQGEKWGFIDPKGSFAIPATYDDVNNFCCGYALVRIDDDKKFIDVNNKIQVTLFMDYADSFYNKYARFKVAGGKYGLLNNECKVAIQPIFEKLEKMGDNGLVGGQAEVEEKFGYYGQDGKVVIQPIYNSVGIFQDGAAVVSINGKYGVIDKNAKWLIPANYDDMENLGHGLICYRQDSKYGILDLDGEIVVPHVYTGYMLPVDNDLIPVTMDGKRWGYIDIKGNLVISLMYIDVTQFYEGYACVQMSKDEPFVIIDTEGTVVLTLAENEEPVKGLHNGLFLVSGWNESTHEKYYKYMDIKGTIVYTWTLKNAHYAPERSAMEDHGKAFMEKTLR